MKNQTNIIYKLMKFINEKNDKDGLWLPLIQRKFVWKPKQIYRFFDSIMQGYPFGTLLIWKIEKGLELRCRAFIQNYKKGSSDCGETIHDRGPKSLVLDGQQRLQSLYIGIEGTHEGKPMHIDILSGEETFPNEDHKYQFKFQNQEACTSAGANTPARLWVNLGKIIKRLADGEPESKIRDSVKKIAANGKSQVSLTPDMLNRMENNISQIRNVFTCQESLGYQEINDTDINNVVEIFIRANEGGSRLKKSDLLFSLLTSGWETAGDNIKKLLGKLQIQGFDKKLDQDFILRTCLTLLDKGARYEISHFRNTETLRNIRSDWKKIEKSICAVVDFLKEQTCINSSKTLLSEAVLIPVIYGHHYYSGNWVNKHRDKIRDYIIRALLKGTFSHSPQTLIDKCTGFIRANKDSSIDEILNTVNEGSETTLNKDRFWAGYGSDTVRLIFNLWHPEFNFKPADDGKSPEVDHLFPKKLLQDSGYESDIINGLPNCLLLTLDENRQKGAKKPIEWLSSRREEFFTKHCIPINKSLWEVAKFQDFVAERKKLMEKKFKEMEIYPWIQENPDD